MLKIVNSLLLLTFIVMTVTVFYMVVLHNYSLVNVHKMAGLLMVVLALVHIYLNFGWIRSNFLKRK